MKKIFLLTSLLFSFGSANASTEERINALEQSVLDLEIKSLFNKINFSGDLLTSIVHTDSEGNTTGPSKVNRSLIMNNLQLHATSVIGKKFKIFTTLEASYYHGEGVVDSASPSFYLNEEVDGDHIRISRAYFDYQVIDKELVFSLGRFPTANGPPSHMYHLEERMGTYPLMAYSLPIDAAALTWNAKNTFGIKDMLTFRIIGSKSIRATRDHEDTGGSTPLANNLSERKAQDDTYISAMFEYGKNDLDFVGKKLNFIFQYVKGELGASQPRIAPAASISDLLPSGWYEVAADNDIMASFDIYNAYFEIMDVFNTNFDFYANYKYSLVRNEANFQATNLAALSTPQDLGKGLFGTKGTADKGKSTLIGTRYKISDTFAVGAEYLFTTYGSMPTTFWTKSKLDIYNTYGKTWHGYLAKSYFNNSVTGGLGYAKTDHNYEFSSGYTNLTRKSNKLYAFINLKF